MCAGESDISSNSTSQKCKDCRNQICGTGFRYKCILQCTSYRWFYHNDHNKDYDNHNGTQYLGNSIHGTFSIFQHKYQDCQKTCQYVTNFGRYSKQCVKTKCSATYVSDIKYQTTEYDQYRYQISQSRKYLIGNILTTKSGHTKHTPDIQLCNGCKDYGNQDNKSKTFLILSGKRCCLCQESWSDCRCGHQKRCAK